MILDLDSLVAGKQTDLLISESQCCIQVGNLADSESESAARATVTVSRRTRIIVCRLGRARQFSGQGPGSVGRCPGRVVHVTPRNFRPCLRGLGEDLWGYQKTWPAPNGIYNYNEWDAKPLTGES